MDKLLNWSLAQNDPETAKKVGAPDPQLLAQLFGANKDDVTLMKESVQIINDKDVSKDDKLTAFDNFEMLIENLDNANNIENLKLWDFLISQLDSNEEEFKILASSIIGTAVQNNPKTQQDFNGHPEGYHKLISNARATNGNEQVKIKTLYALSNLLRNNPDAYRNFDTDDGWDLIGPILINGEISDKLKLRSLSLLSAILSLGLTDDVRSHIKKYQIVVKILQTINAESNISLVDKSLNLVGHLLSEGYKFDENENSEIKRVVDVISNHFQDTINIDDFQVLKQV